MYLRVKFGIALGDVRAVDILMEDRYPLTPIVCVKFSYISECTIMPMPYRSANQLTL